MKKIVDLKLVIDGLILDENESIEDWIDKININSVYPILYEILSEEYYD